MVASILVQFLIHSTAKHKAWEWMEVSQQNNGVNHLSKRPAILSFSQLLHKMEISLFFQVQHQLIQSCTHIQKRKQITRKPKTKWKKQSENKNILGDKYKKTVGKIEYYDGKHL